jgi:CPA2 family monovalent cation:H+ antiporter-2
MATSIIVELGIGLIGLAIAGAVAHRIELSVIPAYIIAGILIGPNEPSSIVGVPLTLVSNNEVIEVLAELGIIFLLFFLGLEFSINQLLQDSDRLVKIGFVDFTINFGVGLLIAMVFEASLLEAVLIAGIVYISSSAVITKSLIDEGWVANPESNPILGTLVFEDILIAVYLAVISAIVFGGGDVSTAVVSVLQAFLFLGILIVIAWYGTGLIDRVFDADADELFLLRVLGITVLVAGAALLAGLSEAVAAFFVGTAFSQTDHTDRIETIVGPAKDLFAAMFFFSIGLTTDVTLLRDILWLLLAAVVITTASKIVSGTISGRIFGLNPTRSVRVGLGMVPRGEFSLVIAAFAAGASLGSLQSLIPAFAVGYVLVMSILGTVLIQQANTITDLLGPVVERGDEVLTGSQ